MPAVSASGGGAPRWRSAFRRTVSDHGTVTETDQQADPPRLGGTARARLAASLDQEGVVAALLFGSRATGRPGPLSDVDVAVWLDPGLDPGGRLDARLRLAAAASAALGAEDVDLVVLNDSPPLLRHRARESGIMLVEKDPPARIRLEAGALIEFLDTQPLRDELARGTRHRVAEGRFGR